MKDDLKLMFFNSVKTAGMISCLVVLMAFLIGGASVITLFVMAPLIPDSAEQEIKNFIPTPFLVGFGCVPIALGSAVLFAILRSGMAEPLSRFSDRRLCCNCRYYNHDPVSQKYLRCALHPQDRRDAVDCSDFTKVTD